MGSCFFPPGRPGDVGDGARSLHGGGGGPSVFLADGRTSRCSGARPPTTPPTPAPGGEQSREDANRPRRSDGPTFGLDGPGYGLGLMLLRDGGERHPRRHRRLGFLRGFHRPPWYVSRPTKVAAFFRLVLHGNSRPNASVEGARGRGIVPRGPGRNRWPVCSPEPWTGSEEQDRPARRNVVPGCFEFRFQEGRGVHGAVEGAGKLGTPVSPTIPTGRAVRS